MNRYQISSRNPAGHYFDICLHIPHSDPDGQVVRLPAWIPGSYMIRDFARNIVDIEAQSEGLPVELRQLDKSSWRLAPVTTEITIHYRVYAWDLSVRSAHLDQTHGFFNGTSVFLEVVGQGHQPCEVTIKRPQTEAAKSWRLATTLTRISGNDLEFGDFSAQDYAELIDHPVEMGDFTCFDFIAGGIPHQVVLTGRFDCDCKGMQQDLTAICEQHIRLFDDKPPMPRYLFLVMVVGEGYGGLEHRSSTSLLCTRDDLLRPGQREQSDGYRRFLGLCSHEYFHSWNVKRIRPAVFDAPDLSREVYTPLLWAFEGITSYYDDLGLLRSGRITLAQYLELFSQTITRVQRNIGRKRQSVAQSSFNAWTKFYKQDENALNAIVSYYAKGALIALCIDMKLRKLSGNKKSLDDLMRRLWQQWKETGAGVEENEIQQLISGLAGEDLSGFLDPMINGTEELPLAEMLSQIGIELHFRIAADDQDTGGKTAENLPQSSIGAVLKPSDSGVQVMATREGEAAQQAGLSAGDEIIAIQGLRASREHLKNIFCHTPAGETIRLDVFRRDELMRLEVALQAAVADTAVLSVQDENHPALQNWMQGA